MKRINSIWSTPECDAWSRDFDYEDYVVLHKRYETTANPVSAEMYTALCNVFNDDYEAGL